MLAHHERQRTGQARPPARSAPGYRPETLAVLCGTPTAAGRTGEFNGPGQPALPRK